MPHFPTSLDYTIIAKYPPLVPHTFSRTCSASLACTPHYHACMPSPLPVLCYWLPLSLELLGLPCPLQGLLQQLCTCLSHMCPHLRLCVAPCTRFCALARMPTLSLTQCHLQFFVQLPSLPNISNDTPSNFHRPLDPQLPLPTTILAHCPGMPNHATIWPIVKSNMPTQCTCLSLITRGVIIILFAFI